MIMLDKTFFKFPFIDWKIFTIESYVLFLSFY